MQRGGRSGDALYAEIERAVNHWRGKILSAIPEYKAATQTGMAVGEGTEEGRGVRTTGPLLFPCQARHP